MKFISLPLIAIVCLISMASPAHAQSELDRVKAKYVQELRDLYKRYAEAGKVDDAAKVVAELKVIGVDAGTPVPRDSTRHFIANTAWKTPTGTIFEFQADGNGKRSFNGKDTTTFVWSQRPGGMVEVKGAAGQGQAETKWLFRFESKTEAYYGSRENDVVHKLQKMR